MKRNIFLEPIVKNLFLTRFFTKTFLILLIIFLTGCEPGKEDTPQVNDVSKEYDDSTQFIKIDFAGKDKASYNIKKIPNKKIYLLKANFSKTSKVSASNTGGVSALKSYSNLNYSGISSGVNRIDHQGAINFMAKPPKTEATGNNSRATVVDYGDSSSKVLGDEKGFWVEDKYGKFITITAKLKGIGQFCYVWVPDDSFDDVTTDNKINQENIDNFIKKFDGTEINYWNDGLYKMVTNIFGTEFGGDYGKDIGDGGRDNDKHISFLVYDIDYDYIDKQQTGTLGYFYPKDYYTQEELDNDSTYSGYKTNYSEMIYLDAYFMQKYPNLMVSTIAHEMQHLINFNMKKIKSGKDSSTWFNEMMSMVCEDLIAENMGIEPEDSPFRWFNYFNSYYYLSGVTDWISEKQFYSYASSYSFGNFLLRNYGGPDLIKFISINNNVDIGAILDGFEQYKISYVNDIEVLNLNINFNEIFENYARALIYEELSLEKNIMTLNREKTSTIAGIEYNVRAANIWNVPQVDNKEKSGPKIFGVKDKVELRPLGFSIHSDDKWQDVSGDITIQLDKPSDSEISTYLIFK